ncbi:MAG TPA: SdpI family protein [Verrucomicrobiae bacterium]|nr:SdpI family protein [Verrucomicrobiae bacterium]
MIIAAISVLLTGLVLFFICLPLIYRKVPMNDLYGFRIPAAFKSEQSWYDINAYSGRKMAGWSWLISASGAAGFFVPTKYFLAYTIGSTATTLFAVGIPIFQTYRWIRRK